MSIEEGEKTVKRLLDLMKQRFQISKGEKMPSMIKKICERDTKDKMERVLDRFEENMVKEVQRLDLVRNFDYVLSLHFLERLGRDGRINAQD